MGPKYCRPSKKRGDFYMSLYLGFLENTCSCVMLLALRIGATFPLPLPSDCKHPGERGDYKAWEYVIGTTGLEKNPFPYNDVPFAN